MADDKSETGAQDRARVAGDEDYEVRHFAAKHGISMRDARALIDAHGNNREELDKAAEIKGRVMSTSEMSAVERIARVLAGQRYSANADGYEPSAADAVDSVWRDHVGDAMAVLKTLREPDAVMADAGDADIWKRMVEAAIRDAEGDPT